MVRDRMEMTGYLIVGMEDALEPIEALRELIENSHKEGANRIEVDITSDQMVFSDNGTGCDDPNIIVTPSISRSRFDLEGTGSKGIGAKEAMATFGRDWEIHSVTRKGRDIGQYRHHHIHWDPEGPLPFKYRERPMRASLAPTDIRAGGTKLIVKDRREGFPRLSAGRLEKWCTTLEQTYRPALSNKNLVIVVSNSDIGFSYRLRNTALDSGLFIEPPKKMDIVVESRDIAIRYGLLKKADDTLSGVHYIFGPKVVSDATGINGISLPLRCYVDVTLSSQWKLLLSTHKNRVRYRDEID